MAPRLRRTRQVTIALGDFWGAEAELRHNIRALVATRVGFARGSVSGPSHPAAEAVEVTYDAEATSLDAVLTTVFGLVDWRPPRLPPHPAPWERFAVFVHSEDDLSRAQEWLARWPKLRASVDDDDFTDLASHLSLRTSFEPAPDADQAVFRRAGVDGGFSSPTVPRLHVVAAGFDYDLPPPDPAGLAAHATLATVAFESGAIALDRDPTSHTAGPASEGEDDPEDPAATDQLVIDRLASGLLRDPDRIAQFAARLAAFGTDIGAAGSELGGLRRCRVSVDPRRLETTLQSYRASVEHTLVCTLRPGYHERFSMRSFVARQQVDDVLDPQGQSPSTLTTRVRTDDMNAGRPPGSPGWPGATGKLGPIGTGNLGGEPWHSYLTPVELRLDCAGPFGPHVMRWENGVLLAPHLQTEAARNERTLVALAQAPSGAPFGGGGRFFNQGTFDSIAGQMCGCWWVQEVWDPRWILQAWHTEPIGPQIWGLNDSFGDRWTLRAEPCSTFPWRRFYAGQSIKGQHYSLPDVTSVTPTTVRRLAATDPTAAAVKVRVLGMLQAFPVSWTIRWLLGALAWLDERRADLHPDDRATVETFLFDCLRPAVLHSLWQGCRTRPSVEFGSIECRYLATGEAAAVDGRIDGDTAQVTVGVAFRWLTHVWARGLAIIDDHLILDARGPAEAHTLDVTVAGWDEPGASATPVLLTRPTTASWDGEAWHLDG